MSEPPSTIELTAEVVASYLSNHQVAATDVPALIRVIYDALADEPEAAGATAVLAATKAQIRKSVTHDAIISFEDGRRYKLLRRHLAKYDLTPAAYRAKWGLPSNYPMVPASYSAVRSAQAIARGLGRKAAPSELPRPAPEKTRKTRAAKARDVDPPNVPVARAPRSKKSGGLSAPRAGPAEG